MPQPLGKTAVPFIEICVWPDGTWCHLCEVHEYTHMSDDYKILPMPEDASDEECDAAALKWAGQ